MKNLPPSVSHVRGNQYRYRWSVGGERHSESFRADTPEELWQAWQEINSLIRRSAGSYDGTLTLRQWHDIWLDTRQRTKAPTTYAGDIYRTTGFVDQYEDIRIRDVQPWMLDTYYTSLHHLDPQTIHGFHRAIHKMFEDAIRKNLIGTNPCKGADAPGPQTRPRIVWTPGQVAQFLEHSQHSRFWPLWLIALHTGMRRSEYARLTWGQLDGNTIRIDRTTVEATGQGSIDRDTTKTGRARPVTIDNETATSLHRHRTQQRTELFAAGIRQTAATTIVTQPDGTPYAPGTITQHWIKEVRDSGIEPYMPLKNCRHTWATIALARGEEVKVVSERLGHANVTITLNTYAQVTAQSQQRAASVLSDAIKEAQH